MPHTEPTHASRANGALSRRTQLMIVLGLALVGLAVFGAGWSGPYFASNAAVAPAQRPAPPRGKDVFRPTAAQLKQLVIAPVQSLMFTTEQKTEGRIAMNGDRTTAVYSPFSGRVTRVIANPGDEVKRDAPLLAVNATEFVQEHNDLVGAFAALNSARSQMAQALVSARRKQSLFEISAGSQQDVQQAQADLVVAQNNARSAEIAWGATRSRLRILGKSDAEIDRLQTADNMDPTAFVTAPIAGTVIDRQVGLGQYIQADPNNRLFSISDLSSVWLVANVRESDAAAMKPGARVRVQVPAYPGRDFDASISYVAASVDPATRRLSVRAVIPNADRALKPEMFASFSIRDGGGTVAPAVPEKAVLFEGDAARVWVAADDGAVTLRAIRPGRNSNGMIEVLDGLRVGENVVTSGSIFIDRAASGD